MHRVGNQIVFESPDKQYKELLDQSQIDSIYERVEESYESIK